MSAAATAITQPKVWVQLIGEQNDDPFKVNFTQGMDIDDLKKSIRAELGLHMGAIRSIYSADNNNEENRIKAYAIVPPPTEGKIGSSGHMPYFYSLYQQYQASETPLAEEIGSAVKPPYFSSLLQNQAAGQLCMFILKLV